MRRVSEFMIAEGTMSTDLCDVVNDHIQKGWQPWGSAYTLNNQIYQPMVHYEEEPNG